MNESLKVRINIHVCHQAMVYHFDKTEFTSFERFCDYIHKYLSNDYYINNLPKYIKRIIFKIVDNVNLIFGFPKSEILVLVLEFFADRLWNDYYDIVFPMKKMYDSIF